MPHGVSRVEFYCASAISKNSVGARQPSAPNTPPPRPALSLRDTNYRIGPTLVDCCAHSPSLLPTPAGEYAGIEYAALPVEYVVFVIMLYPNVIRLCVARR